MRPEETAMAATDLEARMLLPLHWGRFALALHPWDEPIKRIAALSAGKSYYLATPTIG